MASSPGRAGPAHKIRLATFLLAGRLAPSWAHPPAGVTRRLLSQHQLIPPRPSQRAWCDHSKQERASAARRLVVALTFSRWWGWSVTGGSASWWRAGCRGARWVSRRG